MNSATSNSVGVNSWSAGQALILEWESGSELKGWSRSDGDRIIETNGDPIFEGDEGFGEAWERKSL